MEPTTDLTITVRVDTSAARRELEDFRRWAMRVIEEIRAAQAAAGQQPGSPGDRRS